MNKYAYIDGGFFWKRAVTAFDRLWGTTPRLDFNAIRHRLGATKLLYYDCIEEQPKPGENLSDFEKRTAARRTLLKNINQIDLCQVRLGTLKQRQGEKVLKGDPKITQKEVDVKIAVDMLTHAANKIVNRVVLVTGDLDLRPAVESLSELGVIVELVYEPASTAEELIAAADVRRPLKVEDWWAFAPPGFRQTAIQPASRTNANWGESSLQTGRIRDSPVRLLHNNGSLWVLEISNYHGDPGERISFTSTDRDFLVDKHVPFEEGAIEWDAVTT